VSAGRLRTEVAGKEESARAVLDAAGRRIRDDDSMRIDLPDPGVSNSRRIATLGAGERTWVVQGPERVALIGRNGVGKTTLLRRLVADAAGGAACPGESAGEAAPAAMSDAAGAAPPVAGAVRVQAHTERVGYL